MSAADLLNVKNRVRSNMYSYFGERDRESTASVLARQAAEIARQAAEIEHLRAENERMRAEIVMLRAHPPLLSTIDRVIYLWDAPAGCWTVRSEPVGGRCHDFGAGSAAAKIDATGKNSEPTAHAPCEGFGPADPAPASVAPVTRPPKPAFQARALNAGPARIGLYTL